MKTKLMMVILLVLAALFSACSPTPEAAAPAKEEIVVENEVPRVGPYSQLLRANGLVFATAQVAFDPDSGQLIEGDITAQTRQIMNNFAAELAGAGLSLDDAVKVTVYLTDMDDFAAMNAEYAQHFQEPYPVRTCVEVSDLPVEGALLSVDMICIE